MKTLFAATVFTFTTMLALAPIAALAQDRGTDAAMGAASGSSLAGRSARLSAA